MLKFILLFIVTIYIISKVSKYFMRWAFAIAGKKLQKEMEKQQKAHQQYHQQNPTEDTTYQEVNDVKIYIPNNPAGKQSKSKNFPGGEYVDFEEV